MPGDAVTAEKIYLDYDQEELDRQYNQATLVPDNTPYQDQGHAATEQARARWRCELDIPYGDHPDEILDIYRPKTDGGPMLIYTHGGAWRGSSKDTCGGAASIFVPAGGVYATLEFSKAPEVRLDHMVAQVRAGVEFLYSNAARFGADQDQIYLAGHSSGAHMTAMLVVTDWAARGIPSDLIKGFAALSGPFDLVPVKLSARNDYLFLDDQAVERNTPERHLRDNLPPAILGYGGKELEEFQRQNQAFLAAWRAAGLEAQEIIYPDKNHFDVGAAYYNPNDELPKSLLKMMDL